jgi:hypothetical protein
LNRLVVARGGVGNFFSEVRAPEDQRDQEGGLSQSPPLLILLIFSPS